MGLCCSCRNDKPELKNEFTVKTQFIHQRIMDSNHLLSLTQENQLQTSEFYALNLARLITSNPELQIEAIGIDIIWNIIRTYQNDFTSNDYIIYDLRDKSKRKENFLKKFKCINYSLTEMSLFPESRMNQLSKYLTNKKIIIINQGEDVILCEQFIQILLNNDIKVMSFFVLNSLLDEEETRSSSMSQLKSRMDDRWFIHYPYVLLELRSLSYFKSMSYIFIDRNNNTNTNDGFLSLLSGSSSFDTHTHTHTDIDSNRNNNSKYEQFVNQLNVKVILYLTGDEEQFNISLLPIGITLIKINPSLNTIQNSKSICQIIEISKSHLLSQGSFVILYNQDTSITDIIIVNWIVNLLYQLTHYTLNEVKKIVTATCKFLISNIADLLKQIGPDSLLVLSTGCITQLSDIKDKFDIYLSRLKNQTNSLARFQAICSIMEKIVLNILTHPGDNVYYNIKCESNTFKVNISINEYAKKAFETFGFKLNKGTEGELYNLPIDTNLNCLREIYLCFIHSVKRTITSSNDANSELSYGN